MHHLISLNSNDLFKEQMQSEFDDVRYIGRLLILLESAFSDDIKLLAINLLYRLLDNEQIVLLVRKCFGFTILVNTLKLTKSQEIRIGILNLLKTLIQFADNYKDFVSLGLTSTLITFFKYNPLKQPQVYIILLCSIGGPRM